MNRIATLAACSLLALPGVARASSPGAWAVERQRAQAACLGETELSGAHATPIAAFDDRSALDAILVTGLLRRGPPLKVTMLCLYDRRTRKATAIEAQGWPAVRPSR